MPMRSRIKRLLRLALILGVILLIAGYAYVKAGTLLAGPQIVIETPENGATSPESLVHVRGIATNAKETTINGRPMFIDTTGRFDEQLLLAYGYNIIELTAKDAQGRETRETIALVYQ